MTDYDSVFVAGAGGGTGQEVLRLLDPRPPTVTALTRSPDRAARLRELGADHVVVDDLLDPSDLDAALAGIDVVISAVGSSPLAVWTADSLVDGDGVQRLVAAADRSGASAFVTESALGVGDEPVSPLGRVFNLAIGPVQRAKAASEAAIRESSMRHTILRPGVLTDGPRTDTVTVAEPGAKLTGIVSRADVARLLVAAPSTAEAADTTLEVVSTPSTPDEDLGIDWQMPGRR